MTTTLLEAPALLESPPCGDIDLIAVTGPRDWEDAYIVQRALTVATVKFGPFRLLDGACPTGVDEIAHQWALDNETPWRRMPAAWDLCGAGCPTRTHRCLREPKDRYHPGTLDTYCPFAGPRRNRDMIAQRPKLLLAAPPPPGRHRGRGTRNCVKAAQNAGVRVLWMTDLAR